ncbi:MULTISPECIES: DUF423 domain-containing protein [Photorhabdus]|uniref:DUF423 domain-containing protein n=2 Tax=Photorhabdus TaxID=29487 RepID=A0A5B0XAY1_9GAMM|nr:DUF423 domain-containing protein [Photorhabdus heterorhabditis]NHB92434.1 hypothetical protein [Photorhabdus cinerea]NRN29463.1 DUF423 domain-containing protein [Photorhabdus heterorhabditis subsp. aluminescens]KAA1195249.1 DUF423 domain-containing protein [Photorhabdus heterorhabditis]KOY60423.1 hypothetical protein AM629_19495 [Photorhabdus heterorhabditis]MBS9443288.1 DUF423 domain-containing protein [Photorhabdus heterorhabditis]
MNSRLMLIFAGISGFFYVAFGAIGSHLLSPIMEKYQLGWIELGLQYQGIHTLAMMAISAMLMRKVILWFYWSGVFFAVGILLFSGSLYCMALLQVKFFAYITPVGGGSFLIGWILVLIGALRLRKSALRHE